MKEFLASNSVWVYVFIFFGKIIEVACATLRIVMINRGERTKGSLLAFLEFSLWIFITGTVLSDFQNSPQKVVVLALAFALGVFIGSWLENKIALGLSTLQVITTEKPTDLVDRLRESNLGVTIIDGEGKDGPRFILNIHLKRNRVNSTVKLINANIEHCVITISDVKVLKGGYIQK